jgi:hypothetical protein
VPFLLYSSATTHLFHSRSSTLNMSAPQAVETFEVIVGYQPHQEIFTVPRDLLMRRSDLFKTVLSPRWSWFTRHSSLKPVDLSEYPDTFASYLDCALQDSVVPKPRMEGGVQRYDPLIELYTLAEHLLDFTTADLVIDKIISSVHEKLLLPGLQDIKLIYATTVEGSPLRRLMVDYCVFSETGGLSGPKENYPHEYLGDLVEKYMALKDVPIKDAYRSHPDNKADYHRDANADLMDKVSFAVQF